MEGVQFPGSDLSGADFSNAHAVDVDLRDARLSGLHSLASLRGATVGVDQLVELAPTLAVRARSRRAWRRVTPYAAVLMLFVSLRDLQWRRRRFLIGVLATGLVFALAILITGISASFHNEVSRAVAAFGADDWVVSQRATGPFTTPVFFPQAAAAQISATNPGTRTAPVVILRFTVRTTRLRDVNVIGVAPGSVGWPKVQRRPIAERAERDAGRPFARRARRLELVGRRDEVHRGRPDEWRQLLRGYAGRDRVARRRATPGVGWPTTRVGDHRARDRQDPATGAARGNQRGRDLRSAATLEIGNGHDRHPARSPVVGRGRHHRIGAVLAGDRAHARLCGLQGDGRVELVGRRRGSRCRRSSSRCSRRSSPSCSRSC